jgi:hypothetical protein
MVIYGSTHSAIGAFLIITLTIFFGGIFAREYLPAGRRKFAARSNKKKRL